jgi:hypothetical protein
MTHRIVIEWLRIPFYGEADLCNEVIGSAALLMYHGLAVVHTFGQVRCGGLSCSYLCMLLNHRTPLLKISAGAILAVDKPVRQPPLPTPEGVIESAATLKATVLLTSPAFLQVRFFTGRSCQAVFRSETNNLWALSRPGRGTHLMFRS